MKKLIFLFIFLFLILNLSKAQFLINQEWSNPFGNPSSGIDWSASEMDGNGNIITTGHTVISSSQIDVVTSKHSPNGNLLWENQFSIGTNSKNYGVALTIDNFGNSYIAAASYSGFPVNSDIVIIKYDVLGNQLWNKVYDGPANGEDIPSAIINDGSGNIYFTGLSFGINSLSDYVTIKMDGLGNSLWTNRYDYSGLYDVPVDIEFGLGGKIVVTGGSASNLSSWDYATITYDSNLGTQLNENRVLNPGIGLTEPSDMVKDEQGNFFISGNINDPISGYNIRTLKLDSDFNLEWDITYDREGLDDKASSIAIDTNGNIIICGYSSKFNGGKDFLTIKYDSNGNELWSNHYKAPFSDQSAKAKKVAIDQQNNIVVTGEVYKNDNSFVFTVKYNQEGKSLWGVKYDLKEDAPERPTDLHIDNEGSVFVTTKNFDGSSSDYNLIKYWEYKRDKGIVYDSINNPLYREEELIVRFNSNEVIIPNIDNTKVATAPLDFFLSSSAISALERKMPFKLEDATLIRVFKQLNSTNQTSVSRLGESIAIPHFWATFILVLPSGTNIYEVQDSLNSMHPIVFYNHKNYLATLSTDDPLYNEQKSLHPVGVIDNAHVNIEPAWNDIGQTGKAFVKVGVFDSGLDYEHEDFLYNGNPNSSVMIAGWDFTNNEDLMSSEYGPDGDIGDHGTKTAGIIGAIRNNNKGIAGIAGGDRDLSSNFADRGTSLYGLKVFHPENNVEIGGINYISLAESSDAIVTSSLDPANDNIDYDYGLHIQNHSYGWKESQFEEQNGDPPSILEEHLRILKHAIHFAHRNHVSIHAARGNFSSSTQKEWPACFTEHWVMNVGGANSNGNWAGKSYDHGVDLVGPYSSSTIRSLKYLNGTEESVYVSYGATSAATPHVAGAAALVLSHANMPIPDPSNLAPEDVEFILTRTAKDIEFPPATPNWDVYTGYGKLDVGSAIYTLDANSVKHFDNENFPSSVQISLPQEENIQIELIDNYEYYGGTPVELGTYTADVYAVNVTVSHGSNQPIPYEFIWERHSSSNLLPLYSFNSETGNNELDPYEKIEIVNSNSSSATILGYVYKLTDSNGQITWFPFDISNTNSEVKVAYSMLCGDGIVLSDNYLEREANITLFPNPAKNNTTLFIKEFKGNSIQVNLFDIQGKLIRKVYENQNPDSQIIIKSTIDDLSSGMYFYQISSDNLVHSLKFIKL